MILTHWSESIAKLESTTTIDDNLFDYFMLASEVQNFLKDVQEFLSTRISHYWIKFEIDIELSIFTNFRIFFNKRWRRNHVTEWNMLQVHANWQSYIPFFILQKHYLFLFIFLLFWPLPLFRKVDKNDKMYRGEFSQLQPGIMFTTISFLSKNKKWKFWPCL